MRMDMDGQGNVRGWSRGDRGVEMHAEVLKSHIRSQTITRLALYGLAALFLLAASLLIVFAPDGRQAVTTVVAIALLGVALGCAGFATFRFKAVGIALDAGQAARSGQDLSDQGASTETDAVDGQAAE